MTFILASNSNDVPDFIRNLQNEDKEIVEKDASGLFEFSSVFDSWIAPAYTLGINILTILFIAAVISMSFALITKTGHWMKWATNTMIYSFIALLILRIGPILFLTTSAVGFTLIVSSVVSFLQTISFWAAIGMLIVGLTIRLVHKIVSQHPEYFRWSKNLFVGSFIFVLLSGVIPLLFKVV